MKHLISASLLSVIMAAPAMADINVRLSDVKTTDITSYYQLKKVKKTPATRADEDDTEWKSLGVGTYRDDVFSAFDMPSASWSVEILESNVTPGCYKIVNPFGSADCPYFGGKAFEGADLVIHAENPDIVYMEYVELKGVRIQDTDEEGNTVVYQTYLCDMGGYYVDMYAEWGMGPDMLAGMGMPFGKLKNGSITFEANALILDIPEIDEQVTANESGLFRITLPGAPDYDLSVTIDDNCLDDGILSASYMAGEDVGSVKYLVVPGWKKDCTGILRESFLQEVAEKGTPAAGGEIKEKIPFGVHSLVAVAFNAEEEPAESSIAVCYGRTDDASNWISLGKCEYSEAFLRYAYMDMECDPYEVEIEESARKPGVYRLVNPYGEIYPNYGFFRDNDYLAKHGGNHYLVVDASDADRVMIEASPTGIAPEDGEAQLFSVSWYAVQNGIDPDDEDVILDYGTLADGRITFPGGAIATYEEGYGITRGNLEHNFYIQLPESTGVSAVGSEGTPEYFTTSGIKVAKPSKAGIYIRRSGDATTKVIVK